MDIETLRLEREEKRRQRRERIRKILEDDPTSTRRTREETDRTTAASRSSAGENISSSASDRTRYTRSHGDVSDTTSTRSTRTSRLREHNANTPSTRSSTNTSDDTTSRGITTTGRRNEEERTSTLSETAHTRSERTTRSDLASEGGSARNARTTRISRQTKDTESEGPPLNSIRARREARRKRNQEHDDKQNRIIAENGDVGKTSKSDIGNRHRTFKDKKGTEDNDVSKDCQDEVKDLNVIESEKDVHDQRARRNSEDISSRNDKLGEQEDGSVEEGKTGEKEETAESKNTEKDPKKDSMSDETKLSEIGKLDKLDENVEIKVSEDPFDDVAKNEQEVVENTSLEVDDSAAEVEINQLNQKKDIDEVCNVNELKEGSGVKNVEDAIKTRSEELNGDNQASEKEESEQAHVEEKLEIAAEVFKENEDLPSTEEPESETRKSEQLLEEKPLEPSETTALEAVPENSIEIDSKENEELTLDQELVVLEDTPEMPLNLEDKNYPDKSFTETDGEKRKNTLSEGLTELTFKQEDTHLESVVDCTTHDSVEEPDDSSHIANEPQKTMPPDSPKKTKFNTKSDEANVKDSQLRTKRDVSPTKSGVSRTKSDSSDAKNDRLVEKTGVSRKKSADSGTSEGETKIEKTSVENGVSTTKTGAKVNNEEPKNVKTGKLKVGGDSWQKNVRKKKGVADVDRAVELRVLGRTGKIKNKMQSCETRDVESADQWKKEVKKTPRKHKSFDEETEKELRELSSKRELKNIVQSCEKNDQESADAWKREVKKGPKKHKSLDEDAENELREISKSNILKSRIKECEKKDKECAEAWTKEVKMGGKPKDAENETEVSEDLKELSGSGRLKDLISSCSERDAQKEKSWESAKQKVKSADEEEELRELASLSETRSKIIQQCEERDKESAESGMKTIKSGEGSWSFDETTDEELMEIAKTVDVKTRVQLTQEEQIKPREIVKQNDLLEDEELKEINLKGRLEAFKQETEKHAMENKGRTTSSRVSKPVGGRVSPSKGTTDGRMSPNKDFNKQGKASKGETGRISPKKGDSGRTSPTKNRPRSSSGRASPSKDKTSGRVSPTKDRSKTMDDTSTSSGTSKDKTRSSPTIEDTVGRVSLSKDRGRISPTKGDNGRNKGAISTGRTSPTKRDGRISPSKVEIPSTKRNAGGRVSPSKDINIPKKSKLDSIRANLIDSGKNKIKPKRESLNRISKSTAIKDKIVACKERDEAAPRTITFPKTVPKAKVKSVPDEKAEAGENENKVPVNRQAEQFMTIEEEMQGASIKGALSFWKEPVAEAKSEVPDEEAVDVDIKGKMTYWESPKDDEDTTAGRDSPPKDNERPSPMILGNVKQGWQKRNIKLNVAEFIKELLQSNCKRRELKDIQDIKSETKKYLAGGMHAEETRASTEKTNVEDKERAVKVQLENKETSKKDVETADKTAEFSFDDVVNPNEVKQLRDFSNFRRQVRPANRRAAKSNPVRKLQQREDLKTGTETFNDVDDEDEEDAPLKPTAFGRLGRAIEPGDRQSKDLNKFAADALAGLSAKEDVSKITLKKTSKSKAGVSQEKSERDGTAPVMLLQVKGHRHMQTRLVEPSVESLNSTDSFLLVTEKYLHVWNGKDSNVMKKSKASELSNKILQYKLLNCNATVVTIIKDGGVNVGTGLTRTFWNTLGGKKNVKGSKEVPKDGEYEKAVVSSNIVYAVDTSNDTVKLQKMSEHCGKIPKIDMLDSNKAFVFDFGTEVYAWLGRTCDKATRTKAVDLAQEIFEAPFEVHNSLNPITPNTPKDDDECRQLKRPSWALFGRMTERAETILFEQKFLDWPDVAMKIKLDKEKDLLNKNLSKGYAKRIAKIEKSEYQAVELVPYDGAKMGEEPSPIKLILEGVNVGRGRGSYDEIERRGISVTTNSVTVYHSSEKESRQLEEKEWGHFYSAESYVIRWSYSVKASGIRSLKGGESKRDTTGRDQIAYFFWHGRDCSASGKGTSALATIELDSDKSPQIMVDEGLESACFLNMFDGQMIVHHGKLDEAKSIDRDNVFMFCVHHEDEREISLTQIEARSSNLRSRSSFVVVVIDEAIGICVWHGAKSTDEKKQGALRGAKRLATWFQHIFEIKKVDIVELEEGHEGDLFWKALDGKTDYGSLQDVTAKCDNRVRLFTFLSTEGPFLAREILNPTRGKHVSPYPFRQANIYDATQPALFLVDAVREMYLWQGWWPGNSEESESATTTGSAEFRWHRDRKLAMQSVQSYADSVGRQMSKAYVVNAGLEPIEFRALFPFWEDHPDVTRINFESGKVEGKKESMTELLAKLSRDRYTLAELLVRPLPEGVDPLKMEMYLSDEEFQDVFSMNKDEFNKLPKWKKLDQRKKAGLF